MTTPSLQARTSPARLPTFLVIGAARSGTTALYLYLRQHPKVFMSRRKETNYFAFEAPALDFRGPGAEFVNNSVASLEAYQRLFDDAPPDVAIGEASPLYLYSPDAPARIHAPLPDVRLIAILRNPVDQAYSHYLYARKEVIEPLPDFVAALDAQEARRAAHWQPLFQYTAFARYHVQLRRYLEHFSRDRIRLYLYEDFAADPLRVTQDIFRFIGVDDSFVPDVSYRANPGGIPRSELWQSVVMRPNAASKFIGSLLPEAARRRVRDALARANTTREEMPVDARLRLQKDLRGDILGLQDLIGRDLSSWLA
jgi:GNAT superfamily N-acetyltransferase